jgi:hypothetical protein
MAVTKTPFTGSVYLTPEQVEAFGLDPENVGDRQALADAAALRAHVQQQTTWVTDADLAAWAEEQWSDPDRFAAALRLLVSAGFLIQIGSA